MMVDLKIAVLGAGVVGLTTGLELQKQFRGAQITILADKYGRDTTSDVAVGLFRPGTSFSGPTEDITRQWITDAYNYWNDIQITAEALHAGVTQLSGYMFASSHESIVRNHFIEKLVPFYRRATVAELNLCPGNWKYGSFYTTVLTECRLFLPWATRKFENAGGKVLQKQLDSFLDVAGKYDVTVNCTGLGAKYLCNDHKVVPIRGQVLKVHAPWIKTFFYGECDTYIIPGFETVTLGGCRQYESYNMKVDKYDSFSIQERCNALLPSLKGCNIVEERVGLRPHRDPVRLEKQLLNFHETKIKIVHNYGHGGYGVCTAPGTAIYAVKLVREFLSGNSKL